MLSNKSHTIKIRKRFSDFKKECTQTHELSTPYPGAEIATAQKDLKPRKAARPDGILPPETSSHYLLPEYGSTNQHYAY